MQYFRAQPWAVQTYLQQDESDFSLYGNQSREICWGEMYDTHVNLFTVEFAMTFGWKKAKEIGL